MTEEKTQICLKLSRTAIIRKHITLKWLNLLSKEFQMFHPQ